MKKALIIAAHPDDEVLGCGGLIAKYNNLGCIFKVIFISEGSSCRYEDFQCSDAEIAIKTRTKLALKSLNFLGIDNVEFNNLPCGRLDQIPIIKINKIIEKSIKEFKPDSIFTHSPYDANNDHKIIFNSALMATRPGALNAISRLLTFEILSSSEWSFLQTFKPNFFEVITEDDLKKKINGSKHLFY